MDNKQFFQQVAQQQAQQRLANAERRASYLAQQEYERQQQAQQRRILAMQQAEHKRLQAEQEAQIKAQQQEQAQQQAKADKGNFFERLGATIVDWGKDLNMGVLRGIEGIIDLGAGLFGADEFVKKDLSAEVIKYFSPTAAVSGLAGIIPYAVFGKKINDWASEKTYENDSKVASFVGDTIGGVGQMLPAIGIGVLTGGLGASAAVAGAAATGTMAGSAAGAGMEQAYNEGANYGQALGYGLTQGGIELATEAIGGKVFGSSVKNLLKPAGKSVLKTIGKQAIGEAFEEGAAELLNPLSQTIYKGKDALTQYGESEYWGQVGKSALLGASVGGVMQGGSIASTAARNADIGGMKANNISENLNELKTLQTKLNNLQQRGKLTAEMAEKSVKAKDEYMQDISKNLQAMTAEQRTNALSKFGLQGKFNADGTIAQFTQNSTQNAAEGKQGLYTVGVENEDGKTVTMYRQNTPLDNGAMSMSLTGENLIAAPTQNEVNEIAKQGIKTALDLSPNLNYVVADELANAAGKKANAFIDQKTNTLYMSNTATTNDIMQAVAVHEVTHTLEGTKEYGTMIKYVVDNMTEQERAGVGRGRRAPAAKEIADAVAQ